MIVYVRSFFYNFIAVFLSNQLLPGIEVINPTRLPYLRSDLVFSLVLGLLQTLIYPLFRLIFRRVYLWRQALASIVFSLIAYAILKFLPFLGIHVNSLKGYLLGSGVTAMIGILTNYFVMKKSSFRFYSSNSLPDDLSS